MTAADARPVWAEIDLGALVANYRELVGLAGEGVEIVPSVKANAYGHGVVEVVRALAGEGVRVVATGCFDDAVAVRHAGIGVRIVLFGGFLPGAAPALLHHELVPTVDSLAAARAVSGAAAARTAAWIEVDCGLGRLGVPVREAAAFVEAVSALPHLVVEGLFTHLPFLDEPGREWAAAGVEAFRALVEKVRAAGLDVPVTQALASAGLLAGLDGGFSAVCPGHALYGLAPASAAVADTSRLRPVLRALGTRLVHVTVHPHAASAGVGGARHVAAGAVTGVVPLGRYDGYRMAAGGEARMLVRGRRVPVLGLSLEHAVLDLSGVPGVAVGDEVVALGESGGERIELAELAAWQGSSPIDVLMTLGRHLPRRPVGCRTAAESAPLAGAARG